MHQLGSADPASTPSLCAQARPCHARAAMSWAGLAVSWPSTTLYRNTAPSHSCHNTILLYCDTNCFPHALPVTIHGSVLRYNLSPASLPLLQYNATPATQFSPQAAIQSSHFLQYNLVYCNTTSSPQAFFSAIQKLYCNTIFNTHSTCNTLILQYKTYPTCNTILFLQYSWAVA